MSRALMPKRFEPCLTVAESTPDGCAELILDVNGHEVARTVLTPGEPGWFDRMTDWWRAELQRKC